jgi:protein phosphatase PTC7
MRDIHVLVDVQEGDIIVLGSDGLFDNLYDNDILAIVQKSFGQNKPVDVLKTQQIAQQIAVSAHEKAKDKNYFSPFAKGCVLQICDKLTIFRS